MKNFKQRIIAGSIATALLTGFVAPVTTFASTEVPSPDNVSEQASSPSSVDSIDSVGDINAVYAATTGDVHPTVTYNAETDETTLSITDPQMRDLLIENGIPESDLGLFGFARSAGVTKIIWHGQARYGNVDLYLSQGMIQTIHAVRFVGGTFYALAQVYFGSYFSAAYTFVKAVKQAIDIANTKNGRVYHMRSWHYTGATNQ